MNGFTIFVTITLLLRFLFATFIPLIDDEAYHWSWSFGQNLSLSYFDHPAMIAWLEKASTSVLGNSYLSVRLPSFICFSLTCLVFYKLTLEMFGRSAARFVLLMILFTPIWGFGGHVASPEPPFILCWSLGLYVFWQGYREDLKAWSLKKTWILLGLVMGFGLNSKFIIAMLAFGFGVYFLLTPSRRKDLLSPWPWVGIAIATVLCLPIFIWNIGADWPGFKYQFHDRHTGAQIDFARWGIFWAAQLLFYTPVGFFLLIFSYVFGFLKIKEMKWRFLTAIATPSFLVFFPQPLFAEYKPHWIGAAMLTLLIGVGAIWQNGAEWNGKKFFQARSKFISYGLLIILVPLNLFIYSPFLSPWWPKAYRALNHGAEFNPQWDLSNEFYGWEEVGQKAMEKLEALKEKTQKGAFLASQRYETTAQLTWGAKHDVYMLSKSVSQYTVEQKKRGMESLLGQSAIFVASEKYQANPMEYAKWDHCTEEKFPTFRGHGARAERAREFHIWTCENFQGILD